MSEHAGAHGQCPDYGSSYDPCPRGCASGVCVYASDEAHIAWVKQLKDTPVSPELEPSTNVFVRMMNETNTSKLPDPQDDPTEDSGTAMEESAA